MKKLVALSALPVLLASVAQAKGGCPAAVHDAVSRAHPEATIAMCRREVADGRTQWEVRVGEHGRKLELDVAPNGTILQTEEKVALDVVPSSVKAAFAKKYSGSPVISAEKQTRADGNVSFELAFKIGGKQREATFTAKGEFVEEE